MMKIWKAKLAVMRVLLVVITIGYSGLVMYSVVLRYIFNDTIIGIEELATYSAIWAYFIGAAYGSYERSHIAASLVPVVFRNDRARQIVEIIATLLTILIGACMTWFVWLYFDWSLSTRPRSLELGTDLVWFHGAVLVGFAMMTAYTMLELSDRLRILGGRAPLAISPLRAESHADHMPGETTL